MSREPAAVRAAGRGPAARRPAGPAVPMEIDGCIMRREPGGLVADQRGSPDVPFGQQMRQAWDRARGRERAVWVRTDRGDMCSNCGAQRPALGATVCQTCDLTITQVVEP